MLPKADSSSFVLFSLLFVLTLTDPPRTGKQILTCFFSPCTHPRGLGSGVGETDYSGRVRRRGLLDKPGTPVVFKPLLGCCWAVWRTAVLSVLWLLKK